MILKKEKELELENKLLMKKYFSIKVLFISSFIAITCIAAIIIILSQELQEGVEIILITILSTILTSATLSILWEVVAKRSFLQEILIKTNLSKNIDLYGLEKIEKDFSKIDFEDYLSKTKNLTMVVIYGTNTLTNNKYTDYWSKLENLTFVHASTEEGTIEKLADRFSEYSAGRVYIAENIKSKINGAIEAIDALKSKGVQIIRYSNTNMIYSSYYLFDEYAIVANFPHGEKGTKTSLSLICKKGGILYEYIEQEVKSIIENCKKDE